MGIDKAYDSWAENYDAMENRTRDLEQQAAMETLEKYPYSQVVELGCGTGKNTIWLVENADNVIGLDFSPEMLQRAKQKVSADNVEFHRCDLTEVWPVEDNSADLVSCSLTLEHIRDLDHIFRQAYSVLKPGCFFYFCELHPFRQYGGSGARFEKNGETTRLEVFVHHISEYVDAGFKAGFRLLELREWFDGETAGEIPRLASFVFQKN